MLCKCHWIVSYTVHFTAFCLGGPFFPGHGVHPGQFCFVFLTVCFRSVKPEWDEVWKEYTLRPGSGLLVVFLIIDKTELHASVAMAEN